MRGDGAITSKNRQDKETVRGIAKDKLGIPSDLRLVAYYPFALQFWELLDFQDADTGYSVDFRTKVSLTDGWKAFTEGEPIRLKLYGRENAWVRDNQFFAVDAVITKQNDMSFSLSVSSATALDEKQIKLVRSKCESLKPRRNCSRVFSY